MKPYISLEEATKMSQEVLETAWQGMNRYYPDLVKPSISWKRFGFCSAGRTYFMSNRIQMNINYLYSPDWKDFIKYTTLHEVAHVLAYHIFKEAGHGKDWKFVAKLLGDDGERCHTYSKPENKPKSTQYKLQCTCGRIHYISKRTLPDVLRGEYICRYCKENLQKAEREVIYA